MTKKKGKKPSVATEERVARFVEAYCGVAAGNQTEAARAAGYDGTDKTLSELGRRLLQREEVKAALAAKRAADPLFVDGDELRRFWAAAVRGDTHTETVNGKKRRVSPNWKERLRASELAAKALGMFVEKKTVEHTGKVQIVAELPGNGRDDGT